MPSSSLSLSSPAALRPAYSERPICSDLSSNVAKSVGQAVYMSFTSRVIILSSLKPLANTKRIV